MTIFMFCNWDWLSITLVSYVTSDHVDNPWPYGQIFHWTGRAGLSCLKTVLSPAPPALPAKLDDSYKNRRPTCQLVSLCKTVERNTPYYSHNQKANGVEERNNISDDTLASVDNHASILKHKSRQFLNPILYIPKVKLERLPATNVNIGL